MNAAALELFRVSLLQALRNVAPHPLPMATLLTLAKLAGAADATARDIAAECAYLADKGLAAAVDKAVSPENAEWRITAAGRDHLALRGL